MKVLQRRRIIESFSSSFLCAAEGSEDGRLISESDSSEETEIRGLLRDDDSFMGNELRHSTFVPPANALDHGKFVYRKRGSAAKHCRIALESVEASCGKELAVGEAITQLADEPGLKKRTWNGFDGPASACHKTGREEQEDEY
uniref:Uncharacterized protein n=1 Tax=Caenorhabditis japonica TaxID=281687 RepID=A0A8R1II81_CAEJA